MLEGVKEQNKEREGNRRVGRGKKRIYGEKKVEHRGNRNAKEEGEIKKSGITGERKKDTEGTKIGKDKRVKI